MDEAQKYLESAIYPLVAKTTLGASGSGVSFLKNKRDTNRYIHKVFSGKGAPQRWWPNFSKGKIIKRGLHYVYSPKDINKKVDAYLVRKSDLQKDFVIFQKYIPHDFEWRVVAIGDSFFAHKKLKMGEKASGSTLKEYEGPSLKLLDFVYAIVNQHKFFSQAVDIFETSQGDFLVNEMQCIFGQSDEFQMLVDGIAGRYRHIEGNWVFEPGNYNENESYNLRVDQVINLFTKRA